jgi:hypothetical protein
MTVELALPIKTATAIERRFCDIIEALGRAGMAR